MNNQWWALISQIGLWGWILSVVVFLLKAFPRRDSFNASSLGWGTAAILAFALWVLGMTQA